MAQIVNAAPMVIDQGTRDLSTRVVPEATLEIPQHLPKFYIFAEKGPLGPVYVDFNQTTLTALYGDDTFDVNKKYYTHQSVFLQEVASQANNCVIHRLYAPDSQDVANIGMFLDVLPTQVPLFRKNVDGSLVTDATGAPVPEVNSSGTPITVAGFLVKWVLRETVAPVGTYQRGLLAVRNGTQVDSTTGTQSTQYPIFEFAASSPGEFGNKHAVRLHALLESDLTPFPSNILNEGKQYPYSFSFLRITDPVFGRLSAVFNTFGAQSSRFTLQENGVDPTSGAVISLEKIIADEYINVPAHLDKGLGTAFVYNENLRTVLTMLYNAERVISDDHRDAVINNVENNIYAYNIMSFTSSNGSPYQTAKLVDTADSSRLTRNSNLFLKGSSDGTITLELLDSLVSEDMDKYMNTLTEYHDLVLHPESIIYDSGFALATKRDLCKFISRRKDTFVVLSTVAHNTPGLNLSTQTSVGIALKTAIELYPESSTFGTPVMRGAVMVGSGTIINSLYTKRVPTSYELARMASSYMGASNGAWRNGFSFDRAPGSVIRSLKDIDVTWVPTSTRNVLWSVGLNFVLNYKVRTQFFPAIQTVYDNDTSVLNSFFTAVAISFLNKVAHSAWREFTGSISLTNAQLEEKVNNFVANAVKDKFDNKFVIVPNATVTELDNLRGFSWTLPIKIYANNMKTVMTTRVDAFRMSDLEA